MTTININGLKQLQDKVNKISSIQASIDAEIYASILQINANAAVNIQQQGAIDLGELLRSQQISADFTKHVFAAFNDAIYAGFIEFGTGAKVEIPAEMAEEAAQFKNVKTGSFDEFVEKIEGWIRRHGISPITISGNAGSENFHNVAWLIAISILRNGLKARPFLYPAFQKELPNLISNIQKLLKNI